MITIFVTWRWSNTPLAGQIVIRTTGVTVGQGNISYTPRPQVDNVTYENGNAIVLMMQDGDVFEMAPSGGGWIGGFDGTIMKYTGSVNPVLTITPSNRDVSSSSGTTTFDVSNAGGGTMTTAMHGGVGVGDADIIELDWLAQDFVIAEGADTHIDISFDYPNSQKATTAQAGILTELTTTAEVSAGVDTTRAITADALAGSTLGKPALVWFITAPDGVVVDSDGPTSMAFPANFTGYNIVAVAARIITADDAADDIDIGIYNVTQTAEVLSQLMTIEGGEFSTLTSATPGAVDGAESDITLGDVYRIDIDYAGDNAAGLEIHITLEKVT